MRFEIFEKKFDNDYYSIKNDTAKLRFSERQLLDVKNNLIIEPNSLPMISPPIRWSDKKVGGYLNNQIMKNDIVSGSTFHGHKLENRENLYKAVNNMASIKFKYNNLLIDFLENDGKYLLEIFKNSKIIFNRIMMKKKFLYLFKFIKFLLNQIVYYF